MDLKAICEAINTPSHHLSKDGKKDVIRMDELAQEIVSKLGVDVAREIVDIVGPGWEYEFFTLIEAYNKKATSEGD